MHIADSDLSAVINRRSFLRRSVAFAALGPVVLRGAQDAQKMRAAIIGHTGRGNYGHEHELIFNDRDNIHVVGVADPDPQGRAKAAARSGALNQYASYHEMLAKEKPYLVCIAPRWTDQHHAMAMAALNVGSHVYMEKPVSQTLAEADDLIATASKAGLKIAVAHQMRLAPNILALKESLHAGLIGELLEMRSHGKQDNRAGGEDLIVLGVHLFDLMRYFAGKPASCSARVLEDGLEITRADAHPATENIGPVAGNEINAQFGFPKGVHATFTSRGKNREQAGPWGIELIGTTGSVKILMEMIPKIYIATRSPWTEKGRRDEWLPWDRDPTTNFAAADRTTQKANARVVDDWLAAVAGNREPVCSGFAAMKALEMALAVFTAGLSKTRIELPLTNRQHPLQS